MKEYFTFDEIKCPCCNECYKDDDFYVQLTVARIEAGIPFIIESGCRCRKHNKEVGGVSDSAHLFDKEENIKSHGVDIKYKNSRECFIIVDSLLKAGFTRIGIGRTFIHVDNDKVKPQNVIWNYYKED